MSFEQQRLFNILKADTNITTKLSTYGSAAAPAIFMDVQLPADFTGRAALLCYRIEVVDFSLSYGQYRYNIACRASSYASAVALQVAVKDALSRYSNDGLHIHVEGLPVIVPRDKTDDYNAPLSIIIKSKN